MRKQAINDATKPKTIPTATKAESDLTKLVDISGEASSPKAIGSLHLRKLKQILL